MKKLTGLFLLVIIGNGGLAQAKPAPTLVVEARLQPLIFTPIIPLLGSLSCTVSYQGSNYSLSGIWSNGPVTPLGRVTLPYSLYPLIPGRPATINCTGVYMDISFQPIIVHGTATTLPGSPAPTIVLSIQ